VTDPRIESYADLLVERCIDVQPGWQVVVRATPVARPLVEAVVRRIARRGAYALQRIAWPVEQSRFGKDWIKEAPEEALDSIPAITLYEAENEDAAIVIFSAENTREGSDVDPARRARWTKTAQPLARRHRALEIPWNACQYPTPAAAQDAGMTLAQFEDFVYGACLIDWDALGETMRRHAEHFSAAEEVRIVGAGTDITLGIAGREAVVDDGKLNMPGGEFFMSPLEEATEGVIHYSEFPASYFTLGRCEGVRLVFREGRIVEATADTNEEFLLKMLDMDEGARRLGELGIGCNPMIDRHMENVLFDEKIGGTIHLAVGNAYEFAGGTNKSSLHWDMVKDLRAGGEIHLDGELVQKDGKWL